MLPRRVTIFMKSDTHCLVGSSSHVMRAEGHVIFSPLETLFLPGPIASSLSSHRAMV